MLELTATENGPTVLWYASRGSGYTALVLLTLSVILGLVTSVRWTSAGWPRFVSQSLHRSVSLIVIVFLLVHIVVSIADPFAGLSVRDAVVPAGASYRPVWLALGVVSGELFMAIVVTSVVRHRLGFRVWRAVHMLAYVSWPVAVLHGIGTGSDSRSAWALVLTAACVASVIVSFTWRVAQGWPRLAALRVVGMATSIVASVALVAWTVSGPLQPGWARAAGTPGKLLAGGGASSGQSSAGGQASRSQSVPAGLDDQLTGTVARTDNSVTVLLSDVRDQSLTVRITARADGSATIAVLQDATVLCDTAATIGEQVSARCGNVVLAVAVSEAGSGTVTGTITTRVAAP